MRRLWILAPMLLVRCNCSPVDEIGSVPGTLVGTLCDLRTGAGGAAVEMAITVKSNNSSKRAVSEAGGLVRMENVPPDTYDVVLSQDLGDRVDERHVSAVVVKSSQETLVLDPACIAGHNAPGTGWIRGRVCNHHTGGWVTAADVTVQLSNGEVMVTSTAADGTFLLESVPAGEQTVYVRSSTFQRAYQVSVVEGRETSLDSGGTCVGVDPNSGGVEGVFCSPNGTGPLTGATAYVEVGNPAVRISDVTDADGHFIITGLPLGATTVHVEQGAYNRSYPVTITAATITVIGPTSCFVPNPDTTGRIDGSFCNPGGLGPLTGATVTVDVSNGTLEDHTDQAGHFAFAGVEPGPKVVQVHSASFNQSYNVTVVAGQTVTVNQGVTCQQVGGPVGEIVGRICAPNGTTWLANARVWVDTPQGQVSTQTDANGRFQLSNVPVGTYIVHVAAGSFTTDIPNITVRANEITTAGDTADMCVPINDDHRIAVVGGRYDDIAAVLTRLGINNITNYAGEDGSYVAALLTNYTLMQTYDVIFFNCGLDDSFLSDAAGRQMAVANLQAYVASGKSIYVSDWAYDLVEVAWPGYVDFYGNDNTVDTAQIAQHANAAVGTVVDPALRNALGQTTVSINFNLDIWAVMSGASTDTRVYIRGDAMVCDDIYLCFNPTPVTNIPYTVGFVPSGAGKVLYTSFHQEEQTTADMDQILQMLVFEL